MAATVRMDPRELEKELGVELRNRVGRWRVAKEKDVDEGWRVKLRGEEKREREEEARRQKKMENLRGIIKAYHVTLLAVGVGAWLFFSTPLGWIVSFILWAIWGVVWNILFPVIGAAMLVSGMVGFAASFRD